MADPKVHPDFSTDLFAQLHVIAWSVLVSTVGCFRVSSPKARCLYHSCFEVVHLDRGCPYYMHRAPDYVIRFWW